jgi:hypothetical protein
MPGRRRIKPGETYAEGEDIELEPVDPGPEVVEDEQVGPDEHEGGPDDGSH